MANYTLTKKEQEKANKEREKWEKRAIYWHNSIPNFNYDMRGSLTKDVQTATNFEQLELNKRLFLGINLNNWITIIISALNLILLVINIVLFFLH